MVLKLHGTAKWVHKTKIFEPLPWQCWAIRQKDPGSWMTAWSKSLPCPSSLSHQFTLNSDVSGNKQKFKWLVPAVSPWLIPAPPQPDPTPPPAQGTVGREEVPICVDGHILNLLLPCLTGWRPPAGLSSLWSWAREGFLGLPVVQRSGST